MFKKFIQPFIKGLGVLIPLILIVYILYWLISGMETMLKGLLTKTLPYGYYFPGLGIAIIFVAVFVVGLLMYPWMTRKMIQSIETLIRRLPVVGTVYSSIHDVVDLFDGGIKENLGRPVLVEFPQLEMKAIGFLMQNEMGPLGQTVVEDHMVVYLQMSYQIGGYALIVPKNRIQLLDISVEKALQWVLTAGLASSIGADPDREQTEN
ncbi:MAG: DUF502 domain-containing protein [Desulfatiglandaceae bacterium]